MFGIDFRLGFGEVEAMAKRQGLVFVVILSVKYVCFYMRKMCFCQHLRKVRPALQDMISARLSFWYKVFRTRYVHGRSRFPKYNSVFVSISIENEFLPLVAEHIW